VKVVVLQSNYIPWKGYFDLIHDADVFVFYDEVQYTKNDWRNRNRIYTKNGLQWLTIPVNKEAVNGKISEVKLSTDWQELHYKSLYLGYKSAPHFAQLELLINDYLKEKKWQSLKELNQYLIVKISGLIGIKTRFLDSANYRLEGDKIDKLIDLVAQVGGTEYISGPSGMNYLSEAAPLFEAKNIKLTFKKYGNYVPYTQLKDPFEQAVSILDLVANIPFSEIKKHIWEE
jgi:WbqC-like protein family